MQYEEIKVIIIEDEQMWAENLSATLNDLGFTITGLASTFEDAVLLLNNNDFDIALVDININRKNSGIELGKMLSGIYKKPYLFITADTDSHSMEEAIKARPSAYLTKPVHRKSLFANIHGAIHNYNGHLSPAFPSAEPNSDIFFVKHGSKYKQLLWSKVVYLASDKNYTAIFNSLDNNHYYIRSTLAKALSQIIPQHLQSSFAQVNRSEAVQISYINEVLGDEVRTPSKTFTVTEFYMTTLKEKMKVIV